MGVTKCPKCGKEFSENSTQCQNCGYKPNVFKRMFLSMRKNTASINTMTNQNHKINDENSDTSVSNLSEDFQSNIKDIAMTTPTPTPYSIKDSLFAEAGKVIISKGYASIGCLQRYLCIGFNRAAGIMDELCEAGVVGEEEGTRPRKILMTMAEFDKLMATVKVKNETASTQQSQKNSDSRIKLYNNKFDYMEGHDFENYCAILLQNNGFNHVTVTKGSGDQGIDIIAQKDGIKFGIQCKCYASDIGNKAVQEAFSGAKFYDCHVPVVMTNRYFTSSAKELSQKTGVLLWDRTTLLSFIKSSTNTSQVQTPIQQSHVIHLTDREECKKLFNSFKADALKRIDDYLKNKEDNDYANQINDAVLSPIDFYSAEICFSINCIHYVFYSRINQDFFNSPAFYAVCKGKTERAEIIEIEVYYKLTQICYNGISLEILERPEVGTLPTSYESLNTLNSVNEFDIKSRYKAPLNAESFYIAYTY